MRIYSETTPCFDCNKTGDLYAVISGGTELYYCPRCLKKHEIAFVLTDKDGDIKAASKDEATMVEQQMTVRSLYVG